MTQIFMSVMRSRALYAVVLLAAIVLVPFRLFGVLLYFGNISMWALAPAITHVALLFIAIGPESPRRSTFLFVVFYYLLSLVFFIAEDAVKRIGVGDFLWLDALEMICIALLFLRGAILIAQTRTGKEQGDFREPKVERE